VKAKSIKKSLASLVSCSTVWGKRKREIVSGALEEGDGLGAADTVVTIQMGASKISIEEIDIRCCRCHCRIQQHRLI